MIEVYSGSHESKCVIHWIFRDHICALGKLYLLLIFTPLHAADVVEGFFVPLAPTRSSWLQGFFEGI